MLMRPTILTQRGRVTVTMDTSTGRRGAAVGPGAGGKAVSDDGHSGRIGALYLVLLIDLVLNNVFEPPPPNLTSVHQARAEAK